MKRFVLFAFILLFIVLTGCNVNGEANNNVNGEPDITGTVNEVKSSSILVEDKKLGLIWLSLPEGSDSKNFEKGQSVAIWTDGKIRESYPLQGTALKIEVVD
ncbi:DUF3221 domain-containing protein [Neobacillus niacini]|uniref:DUF3221 domain-containing protein n=1 Tax=Neobacillus niacini TaxID=86668 RepID=UPI001C8E7DB9|nr:DUF3221 domain-containing protein [Neobacillus niacini]MBY0146293.1 DUF3221 domain-containing protein [Neobacillus niacini]